MTELVVPIPLPPALARLRNYAGPPTPAGAARTWFEFRNATGDPNGGENDSAELLVYDEIGDGGWFGGGVSATSFADALRQVTAPNLTVRLNSPGGDVFDGISVANLLRAHPSNVTVAVDGIAASIASVIAMAGDKIVMGPQSQMMIHDAMGSTWGGNPADHRAMADLLDRQSDNIAAAYRAKAGGMTKSWRTRMQAETWYSADEAVAAGLADSVGTVPTSTGPSPSTANPSTGYDDWWDRSTKVFDLGARFHFAGRVHAPDPDIPGVPARPGVHSNRAWIGERGPELHARTDDGRLVPTGLPADGGLVSANPQASADELAPPADDDQVPTDDGASADDDQALAADTADAPADDEEKPADSQDAVSNEEDTAPDWAAVTAHLISAPDTWAAATAHLTGG